MGGRLYIRIRLCAQSDGGTLIDSGSPTNHAERLVRPWGHLSVQRSFNLRSGDVSEPAWWMATKPTRAKRGPKVSPCGTDEAQPNKHSGRRARTTPKRALWRGPSASEVLPLVSYRASAGVVLRWEQRESRRSYCVQHEYSWGALGTQRPEHQRGTAPGARSSSFRLHEIHEIGSRN